jgi:hypothetical protein
MGAWTEIVDYTVPSNTTSVVLNDFGTITKNDFIKVVATLINTSSSNNSISLFGNTATTNTDYHRQGLLGEGTSIVAARQDVNRFDDVIANQTSTAVGYIKISENDRLNIWSNTTRQNTSLVQVLFNVITSSGATFSSGITTLTFTGSQTNGIGTGSRIQIYRLDAVKVADITTTANATQVDISSLSIGKDSEYLLVSDILSNATGDGFALMVNDNTTSTNYYSQGIIGNGSSTIAARENAPTYQITRDNLRNLGYAHIKLSEIGAYTAQTYNIELVGDSGIQLRNYFISSTAENITSITKINIKASATDRIRIGSRFILYKLK